MMILVVSLSESCHLLPVRGTSQEATSQSTYTSVIKNCFVAAANDDGDSTVLSPALAALVLQLASALAGVFGSCDCCASASEALQRSIHCPTVLIVYMSYRCGVPRGGNLTLKFDKNERCFVVADDGDGDDTVLPAVLAIAGPALQLALALALAGVSGSVRLRRLGLRGFDIIVDGRREVTCWLPWWE